MVGVWFVAWVSVLGLSSGLGPGAPGLSRMRVRMGCSSSGLTRRDVGGVLLAGASTVALPKPGAFASGEESLRYVAVAGDVASRPSPAFAAVESRYGLRFVEYCARLLLNYDGGSRAWWESQRRIASGLASCAAGPASARARPVPRTLRSATRPLNVAPGTPEGTGRPRVRRDER